MPIIEVHKKSQPMKCFCEKPTFCAIAKGVNTIVKGVDVHINTIKVIMAGGGGRL
jgi:hypothetical protein